jgi:hypothetical protein
MIGVMAVAIIIALAFALTTTKSLDRAFASNESSIMQNFASALQSSALRNVYIPGSNDMAQAIATELGVNLNMVQNTDRRNARFFFVDPAFTINTTNCGSGYVQTTDGAYSTSFSTAPYRIMILSGIAAALPKISITAANFNTIWTTTDGQIPASPDFNGWKGSWGDVVIQRMNLTPLFINLQLSKDSSAGAQYMIQGAGPLTVGSSGLNSSYLQNTLVTLVNASSSPTVTNAELMLNRALSFFFVQNFWRSVPYAPAAVSPSQTNGAAGDLATAIAITAGIFANSPYNVNANSGTTPPGVLNLMSNFMAAYVPYADWVVNSNGGTWAAPTQTDPNYGIYTNAKYYQTLMSSAMVNLANPSGGSGNVIEGGCSNGPAQ